MKIPIEVKKIALIYSPIAEGLALLSTVQKVQRRPGLGLRYIKSILLEQNIDVDLYDNLYDVNAADVLFNILNQKKYDLIGFHTTSASIPSVLKTISKLNSEWYSGRIIAGGPGTLHFKKLLESGIDVIVFGEGEETIKHVINGLKGNCSLNTISGIAFYENNNLIITNKSDIVDLNRIPYPYWEKNNNKIYGDLFNITIKKPYYVVMASRGCPFNCSFCSTHLYWRKKYRLREVNNVIDEIKFLITKRNAKYIHFLDDIFGLNPKWIEEFIIEVKKTKLKFNFSIVLHPMSYRNNRYSIFSGLKDIGCSLISFGAQSANKDILKNINRLECEPQELEDAISKTNNLNIVSVLTYILGLPGETRETIKETLQFVNKVKPTIVDFHPLLYLPGSEIVESFSKDQYCKISDSELSRLCLYSSFNYYILHGGLVRVLMYIVKNNLSWFLNLFDIISYIFQFMKQINSKSLTTKYFDKLNSKIN
ncbi:MAG: radical SAM protein [uncultured bacterium]|nr:MAG: radical SAM protein [uncultured bacterium]